MKSWRTAGYDEKQIRFSDLSPMWCGKCGAEAGGGLSHCGTRFRIRDLFPRVVNFFFIKTKSIASYKQIFTQTMTLSMASVFIITLFHNMFTNFRRCRPAVQQLYDGTASWWYDRLSGGRCKTSGCVLTGMA